MLEMMMNKMTIDLNVLSLFMKNRVVNNLNRILVVTIHRSRMRERNSHISSNQYNQTMSLVVDVIARYSILVED
jgi:hypothetical protein